MSIQTWKDRPWLLTASLVLALAGTGLLGLKASPRTGDHNPPATIKMAPTASPSNRGFSPVVKQVIPAVVKISAVKTVNNEVGQLRGSRGQQGDDMDEMFRQFFGNQFQFRNPQPHRQHGMGSGVIISPEGYILTNHHVVEGANEVTVTLLDKREFKARLVGADPRTDIAVLKIESSGSFPYLALADSSKVEVGDVVLAIGNPFGVGQTVTMGIVSATSRGGLGIEQVEDFIQTDAAINPGNSGGALVNEQGHLIGINTAILGSGSGGNQGIGFAVPINMARHDLDQIIAHGKVERAYLGILPQDVTPTLASAFHAETKGALVGDVTPDSPAARANLKKGDIILDINGQPIEDANQLRLKIGLLAVGSEAKLNVLRDGKKMTTSAKLTSFPEEEKQAKLDDRSMPSDGAVLGVSLQNLTPDMARQLKLGKDSTGVMIQEVNPDGRAAEAGLRPGDVIQEVNHQAVKDVSDVKRILSATNKDATVLLLVHRGGNTIYVTA